MWKRLKHIFIPCEGNTFKPHFLERFSMGIMLFLVLITFAVSNIQALVWIGSDWMVSTVLPAVIVDLTNDERGEDSLGTLRRNKVLDAAAALKAADMAKGSYFAHTSPTGVSPWHWFDEAGYKFVYAGENLAVHFTDSSDVVDAWMKSPTHRANIMNGNYTEIGVGTAKGTYKGTPTVFVVQLFGTPKKLPAGTPTNTQITKTTEPAKSSLALNSRTDQEDVLAVQAVRSDVTTLTPTSAPTNTNLETAKENSEMLKTTTNGVAEFSDLATTSRDGVPAIIDFQDGESVNGGGTPAVIRSGLTQPNSWLQFVYGLLALIVVSSLTVSIIVEWRKQNPLQIAYAGGLLAVTGVLFYVNVALTSGVTIL